MSGYLEKACNKLGVSVEAVMSYRLYDSHITLIVEPGPEYHIEFSELDALYPKQESMTSTPEPEPEVDFTMSGDPDPEPIEVDATDGALELASEYGLNLSDYYQGERLTYYDVKDIAEREGLLNG